MPFEYKVVAAPAKGVKVKGVKNPEARFALAVEQAINALAVDGWQYVRTDVLPSEERQGLTGSVTNWRNLMVFQRPVEAEIPVAEVADDAPASRVEPVLTAQTVTSAVPEGDGIAEIPAQEDDRESADSEQGFEEGEEETRPA